jgi:hypothetical protein
MKLYKEAENDLVNFKKTLPHWHWTEKFLQENSPVTVKEALDENKHNVKVAGKCMNGLALTFFPSHAHRDVSGNSHVPTLKLLDRAACLLSYLHGPFADDWVDGAFLVRMFGLRIPVAERDVVLFCSQLWHEVCQTNGIRFSLVSYCKRFGAVDDCGSKLLVPEEIQWVLNPNFGLF